MENVQADVMSAPASLAGAETTAPVMKTQSNAYHHTTATNVPEMETVPVARARVATCLGPVNNTLASIVRSILEVECVRRCRTVSTVKLSIWTIVLIIASSNWNILRTTLSKSRVTILRSNLLALHGMVTANIHIQVKYL